MSSQESDFLQPVLCVNLSTVHCLVLAMAAIVFYVFLIALCFNLFYIAKCSTNFNLCFHQSYVPICINGEWTSLRVPKYARANYVVNSVVSNPPETIPVCINGVQVPMEVDTGSGVTIVSEMFF